MRYKTKKILIVEDEMALAERIQDVLEELGYIVSGIATSGKEAIKEAKEAGPDLVLMDIFLKGEMDGMEAAQQIQTCFDIPVVYLTGHLDEGILERAKTTDPFGYVLKPFEARVLYTNIEMALYKHQMEKKLKDLVEEQTAKLKKANEELKRKIHDLEVFHKATVDRELRMIELKKEIKELKEQLRQENLTLNNTEVH